MDILNRHYTESNFSDLLVSFIDYEPKNILELGIGGGSLMNAALGKWTNVKYIGFDKDRNAIKKISEQPNVTVEYADLLNGRKSLSQIKVNSFDIALCNPPYQRLKYNKKYNQLLTELNFMPQSFPLTSDIIFLLENLKYLKKNGVLGIILPDTIIANKEFIEFRKQLLTSYNVEKIIELPERIFTKTDAKTYILIIKNIKPVLKTCSLFISDYNGNCSKPIDITNNCLVSRMDYTYHFYLQGISKFNSELTLKDCAQIKRGAYTHIQLKTKDGLFIHSTCFKDRQILKLSNKYSKPLKDKEKVVAGKGSILMVRVGRNCGKTSLIKQGQKIPSDCLYIIKPYNCSSEKLFSYLCSDEVKEWILANRHGVCAKVISKSDLESLPIPFDILSN